MTSIAGNCQPAQGRWRYVAVNMAAWCVLFAAGVGVLLAAHRLGKDYLAEQEARLAVRQARDAFRQGDLTAAQQLLTTTLSSRPGAGSYALETLGPDLLAIPRVHALLTGASHGPDSARAAWNALRPFDQAKLLLIAGNVREAEALLGELAQQPGADPRALRWLATAALDRGGIETAARHFEQYWRARQSARNAELQAIEQGHASNGPAGTRAAELANALWWAGLWDEAIDAASEVWDMPGHDGLLVYKAVQLELDGQSSEAAAVYREVLEVIPTHRLSRQRLAEIAP